MMEYIIALVIIICVIGLFFVIKNYMFPKLDIVGSSMYPTLIDGERKKSRRFFNRFESPKIGRIYVYRDPTNKLVIKRLKMVYNDLCYFVGDNPTVSYDCRYYGFIDKKRIVALLME